MGRDGEGWGETRRTHHTFLAGRALVRVQEPIPLTNISEPEPDIAVVRIQPRQYRDRHPEPQDIFLLVEVADTTQASDRQKKAASYAKAKIADYWILDVAQERVFVLRNPEGNHYGRESILFADAILSAIAFPDIQISLEQFHKV